MKSEIADNLRDLAADFECKSNEIFDASTLCRVLVRGQIATMYALASLIDGAQIDKEGWSGEEESQNEEGGCELCIFRKVKEREDCSKVCGKDDPVESNALG